MYRLEYLDLFMHVSVDKSGDCITDSRITGLLATCVTVIKILPQHLACDVEIAATALVLEPLDEGLEPVGVVVDCLVTA